MRGPRMRCEEGGRPNVCEQCEEWRQARGRSPNECEQREWVSGGVGEGRGGRGGVGGPVFVAEWSRTGRDTAGQPRHALGAPPPPPRPVVAQPRPSAPRSLGSSPVTLTRHRQLIEQRCLANSSCRASLSVTQRCSPCRATRSWPLTAAAWEGPRATP